MGRVMFLMECKPGMEDEYKRRHKLLMDSCPDSNTEPEGSEEEIQLCKKVWKLHKNAGIKNYSIFMKEDTLYAYMEADDYNKALDKVTSNKIGRKWQEFMNGILKQKDGKPVFNMIEEEIFHME